MLEYKFCNCKEYVEDWAICDDVGEPKGQCESCGEKWFRHSDDALPEHERNAPSLEGIREFNMKKECLCEWCQVTSPMLKKIAEVLPDEETKKFFDGFILSYMQFEEDSTYYKMISEGDWQCEKQDLQRTIDFLTKKMHERFPEEKKKKIGLTYYE